MYKFSNRSKNNLEYVKKDLVILSTYVLATSDIDFVITEGYRSQSKQNKKYAQGRTEPGEVVTWTLKSKHTQGKAIDLYPHPIPKDLRNIPNGYREKQLYLREHFKKCAVFLGIPIRIIEKDLPHIELGRANYG